MIDEPVARDPDDADRQVAVGRVGEAGLLERARARALPNPPVATLSSNVTTSRLPRAWSRISWRSSGLANRALMTPTDQPSASSASAASTARITIGPKPTNSRSRPSRSTSPCPTGIARRLDRRQAEPGVARVVQRERVVLGERGPQQRAQLLLVLRASDDEVRQLALGGEREHALVARAVLADEPGAVDRDEHRLVVLADVVDGLVERALEERRVERDDRPHPAHREAGRERHRVLLGDADVEEAVRELGLELRQAGAGRHAGGDRDDPPVRPRQLDQLGDEDRRVVRGLRLGAAAAAAGGAASSAIDSVGILPSVRAPLYASAPGLTVIGGRAAPWKPTWSVSAGR